jgi:hypothetical protein
MVTFAVCRHFANKEAARIYTATHLPCTLVGNWQLTHQNGTEQLSLAEDGTLTMTMPSGTEHKLAGRRVTGTWRVDQAEVSWKVMGTLLDLSYGIKRSDMFNDRYPLLAQTAKGFQLKALNETYQVTLLSRPHGLRCPAP